MEVSTRFRDVPVTVGTFSGPLDLLLHLVQSRQLPVTTVSLRAVTEQFLAALGPIEEAQPELLADFLAVASRLTALKARALLPRPAAEQQEEPEDRLVHDLAVYQAFREAAAWLQARETAGFRSWTRVPRLWPEPRVVRGSPEQLTRALLRWARRCRPVPRLLRLRPVVALPTMIERLRARLRGRQTFRVLLGARPTASEVAVGLLALLTLVRRREVVVEQPEPFGAIWVERRISDGAG